MKLKRPGSGIRRVCARVVVVLVCFCFSVQAASASYVGAAIAVAAVVVSIAGSAAAGKAAKAAARADAERFQALMAMILALQTDVKTVIGELEKVKKTLASLPASILFDQRVESVQDSFGVVLQLGMEISEASPNAFTDQRVVQLDILVNQAMRDLEFFKRRLLEHEDLIAVANLAMLQEVISLAHHALALYTTTQQEERERIIALLERAACTGDDCDAPPTDAPIGKTPAYEAHAAFLRSMAGTWAAALTPATKLMSFLHSDGFHCCSATWNDYGSGAVKYASPNGILPNGRKLGVEESARLVASVSATKLSGQTVVSTHAPAMVCSIWLPYVETIGETYDWDMSGNLFVEQDPVPWALPLGAVIDVGLVDVWRTDTFRDGRLSSSHEMTAEIDGAPTQTSVVPYFEPTRFHDFESEVLASCGAASGNVFASSTYVGRNRDEALAAIGGGELNLQELREWVQIDSATNPLRDVTVITVDEPKAGEVPTEYDLKKLEMVLKANGYVAALDAFTNTLEQLHELESQ